MSHTFGVSDWLRPVPTSPRARPKAAVELVGFFKIVPKPPVHILCMVACTLDDPDLCAVCVAGKPARYHRPWAFVWDRPAPLTPMLLEADRLRHELRTRDGFQDRRVHNSAMNPDLFARFPPLTHHDRLRIKAWVADCQARAHAHGAPV